MRIVPEQNTFISPIDKYGRIPNQQIGIFAKSGYSKGLISEGLVDWYHKHGFLIFIISDPKMENEYAYQMFEPEEPYHLAHLRLVSSLVGAWKLPGKQNVKIYHPFTNDLPTNRLLPNFNVFTVPLKSLGRNEWSMLSEVHGENETVTLLLKASEEISDEEGLYSFAHYVQNSIKGKGSAKKKKPDWKNFGLESGVATMKELTKVSSALRPFKRHYFLAKQNCKYNLDWKNILTDQKNYHVFVSNFIGRKEEKVTDFLVLYLLESILKNKQYLKHPILVVIPEISYLCPYRPYGHKEFLANSIKRNLKTMRSEGRGMSSLSDSQVFGDVDEDLRGSFTAQLFGELGDIKDVENLCKALGYGKTIKEQLSQAEIPRTYLIRGVEEGSVEDGGYLFFYPKAMHCEPHYNFEEMYRKHNRENPKEYPMKSFKMMSEDMKKMFKEEENRIKEKVKRKQKQEEDEEKRKKAEKETKKLGTDDVQKEKVKNTEEKNKELLWKLCHEMRNDESIDLRERSYRKIGIKFGVDKKTAQSYIEKWDKELKKEEGKDFEEGFIEDEDN